MTQKWTQGPWEIVEISKPTATNHGNWQICHIGVAALQVRHNGSSEGYANARLITAAPQLVEALVLAEATISRLAERHGAAAVGSVQGTLSETRAALKAAGWEG